jgi:hypothetical protein
MAHRDRHQQVTNAGARSDRRLRERLQPLLLLVAPLAILMTR